MRKNHETARISVTLPTEMLQDFKLRSEQTGLSISRLIYLRLRSRTPKLLVTSDVLSEITDMNKKPEKIIFIKGLTFLEIGHDNAVSYLLWLVAHISLLANIFAKNRRKTNARITSTPAYSQEFVTQMYDSLVLLNDFSNTVGASNNKARENAETAIRAIGDGIFAGKMNITNLSEGRTVDVQCVLTITGEDKLGLSESSFYRLIILPITDETFDKKILNTYRDNTEQHDVLERYFALFVQFLSECGFNVGEECASHFAQYYSFYDSNYSVPRFIDAATTMAVEIDLIAEFAGYCGMIDSEIEAFREQALNSVNDIIAQNLKDSKEAKPEIRFLIALTQSIVTEKFNGLAENEADYIANSSNFIGFKEGKIKILRLRFEDAYNLVKRFYRRQNEQFLTSAKTIKDLLLQKNLSDEKLAEDGQGINESNLAKYPSKTIPSKFEDVVNHPYRLESIIPKIPSLRFFATFSPEYIGIYDSVDGAVEFLYHIKFSNLKEFNSEDKAKFWLNEYFLLPLFSIYAYCTEEIKYISKRPLNTAVPIYYRQRWKNHLKAINHLPFAQPQFLSLSESINI